MASVRGLINPTMLCGFTVSAVKFNTVIHHINLHAFRHKNTVIVYSVGEQAYNNIMENV